MKESTDYIWEFLGNNKGTAIKIIIILLILLQILIAIPIKWDGIFFLLI